MIRPTSEGAVLIRSYVPSDREACLDLLRSNIPEHFSPPETEEFARFLDALPGPYFVAEVDGRIVGCGGIAVEKDGVTATLCWGIVEATRQRTGVGTRLLERRLGGFLAEHPEIRRVQMHTSQKVQGFYAKHGFVVASVVPQGFGPELDLVTMVRERG